MPETAAAIGVLAGATEATSAATILGAAATVAQTALVVYGLYQSLRAKRAGGPEFPGQDQPWRGTDVPKWIAYGRCAPTPGLVYHCVHPGNPQYYSAVFDVAHHEIDAFEDFLLNNESVGALGNGVWNGETYGSGHALAGTLVQPGSKWFKSWTEAYSQTVTWPASGATITLDYPVERYETIAVYSGDATNPGQVLAGNVNASGYGHWQGTQTADEASRTLTVLTADYEGRQVVITYRKRTGEPLLRIRTFKGLPAGERDTVLEADSGGEWSATDVGAGVARMVMTFKWDMEVFGAIPFPDPKAVIRGKKIKTWSSGTTEWTHNGVSCIADYLTDATFGFGVPSTDISSSVTIAGESVCAETVASDDAGGLHARYTIDGVLFTSDTLFDNLRKMIAAVAGSAAYSGGQWLIRAGAYEIPALTLDDEHFARGPKDSVPFTPTRDNFNCISGRFTDPANGYRPNAWKPYESATYIAQDSDEKNYREIDLPLTTDGVRARRIAKQVLFRSRNAYTWAASYNMTAYPLQPGDGVYLKHKRRLWNTQNSGAGKSFYVAKRRLTTQGTIQLTCVEDVAAWYAWDFDEAIGPDPAPNNSLPNPRYVAPLQGFTADSGPLTYRRLPDGSIIPYVRISWTQIPEESRPLGGVIEILMKQAGDEGFRKAQVRLDEVEYLLEPVTALDTWNITAYVKNSVGAQSEPVFAAHTVSPNIPPLRNGPPTTGKNLWRNATVAAGPAQHTTGVYATGAIAYAGAPESATDAVGGVLNANPSNLVMRGTGVSGDAIFWINPALPCAPGDRIELYASVLTRGCQGRVQINFFNSSGGLVGYERSTLSADLAGESDAAKDLATRGNYTQTGCFATAPDGTQYAIPYIVGVFASTATAKWAFTEPFIGFATNTQVDHTAWSGGWANSVGSLDVEAGAVVEVYKPATSLDDAVMNTATASIDRELLRFTPPISGIVEVQLMGEALSQPTGTPYILEAGVLVRTPPSALKATSDTSVLHMVPGGDFVTTGMTKRAWAAVTAGVEVVVSLYGYRYSKVVRKDLSSSSPAGTDTFRSLQVHAVLHKRAT